MFMSDCITEQQSLNYAQIPINADVLITHTPPFGILDFDDNINYGSDELLSRIEVVQTTYAPFRTYTCPAWNESPQWHHFLKWSSNEC